MKPSLILFPSLPLPLTLPLGTLSDFLPLTAFESSLKFTAPHSLCLFSFWTLSQILSPSFPLPVPHLWSFLRFSTHYSSASLLLEALSDFLTLTTSAFHSLWKLSSILFLSLSLSARRSLCLSPPLEFLSYSLFLTTSGYLSLPLEAFSHSLGPFPLTLIPSVCHSFLMFTQILCPSFPLALTPFRNPLKFFASHCLWKPISNSLLLTSPTSHFPWKPISNSLLLTPASHFFWKPSQIQCPSLLLPLTLLHIL